MRKQEIRVQRLENRQYFVLKFSLFFLFLFSIFYFLFSLRFVSAQEIPPETKKNVVQNYKADLNKNIAFGTDCSLKPRGDANCDKVVNQFDLSIWEVEFSSANSPRRSDFNNDGFVDLLDFGIWRNIFYPPSSASTHPDQYLAQSEGIINLLSSIFNFQFSIFNSANAQEPPASTQPLRSSLPFVSNSGNSMITNSDGNSTQQVNFDSQGNPLNSQFFNTNGDLITGVTFLNSGTTTVSTQQDGISIQTTRTGEGSVFQFFRNPDGTLIANKSWPTQASYDNNDPPQAVTLPGKDNNSFLTLNIQPNGNSLLQQIDKNGNAIKLSYLTGNGIYGSYNTQNNSTVTSLLSAKVTSMSIDNNLGGKTIYNIIDNLVLSVTQTDSKNNTWVATPQGNYESWELIKLNSGETTTVPDPMKAINSTSPNPLDLIKTWNYYTEAAKTSNPTIDFTTGFNSNLPALSRQVTAADDLYKIAQTPTPPDVLGIVKEVFAAETIDKRDSKSIDGNFVQVEVFRGDDTWNNGSGSINIQVTPYSAAPGGGSQQSGPPATVTLPAGASTPDISGIPNLSPTGALNAAITEARNQGANPTAFSGISVPPDPAAAQPAAPPAAPVAPAPAAQVGTQFAGIPTQSCSGACATAVTNLNNYEHAKAAAGGNLTVQQWAAQQNSITQTQVSEMQAIQTAHQAFGQQVKDSLGDKSGFYDDALAGKLPGANGQAATQPGLFGAAVAAFVAAGLTPEQAVQRATAIQGSVIQTTTGLPAGTPAGTIPGVTQTTPTSGSSGPSGGASAPAASATGPGSLPAPPPGTQNLPTAPGVTVAGTFNGLNIQTTRGADGFWTTQIAGGRETPGGATHHFGYDKDTGALTEFFDKADGTRTTVVDGVMTEISGKTAGGEQFSINVNVANSLPDGWSGADATTFVQQQMAERAYSQGYQEGDIVPSWTVADDGSVTQNTSALMGMSTCFLKGTLISTPKGQIPIETLKPGDKVYSYNEKTGQKEVSDFKQLDINFVDEYLVINGKIHTTVYHPFYVLQSKQASSAYIVLAESSRGAERRSDLDENKIKIATPTAHNDTILKTVRADELKIGDNLPTEEGRYVPVYSIEKVNAAKTTVYNLMGVSPNNNFFAEGILVHNYPGPDNDNYDASFNEVSFDTESSSDESTSESTQDESAPAEGDTGGDSGGNDDSGSSGSIDATAF